MDVKPSPNSSPAATTPPKVTTRELFPGSCKQLLIEHEGEVYSLRITSKGRLILTK
ncbi:hemin uptake protein HemP [Marinospirillum perlucidum]|uniref:hemin uptake protein HemP n=1 Tax=Marinospirillum perlucidum TaxID=1982602 RepID=UPI000DF364DF|nr:hemin uptake protein HemP [Marinospirillum perlucidum]